MEYDWILKRIWRNSRNAYNYTIYLNSFTLLKRGKEDRLIHSEDFEPALAKYLTPTEHLSLHIIVNGMKNNITLSTEIPLFNEDKDRVEKLLTIVNSKLFYGHVYYEKNKIHYSSNLMYRRSKLDMTDIRYGLLNIFEEMGYIYFLAKSFHQELSRRKLYLFGSNINDSIRMQVNEILKLENIEDENIFVIVDEKNKEIYANQLKSYGINNFTIYDRNVDYSGLGNVDCFIFADLDAISISDILYYNIKKSYSIGFLDVNISKDYDVSNLIRQNPQAIFICFGKSSMYMGYDAQMLINTIIPESFREEETYNGNRMKQGYNFIHEGYIYLEKDKDKFEQFILDNTKTSTANNIMVPNDGYIVVLGDHYKENF